MSEEQTERLNNENNFQTQVLAALASLNNSLTSGLAGLDARMAALEERVSSLELKVTRLDARLTSLEERLVTLEEKVDSRLRETRPIWEAVLSRLDLIDSKLNVLGLDMLTMRGEIDLLKQRVPPAA